MDVKCMCLILRKRYRSYPMIRQVIEVQKKIHLSRDTHLALEISLSIPASHDCLTASLRVSFRASGMSRGDSLMTSAKLWDYFLPPMSHYVSS